MRKRGVKEYVVEEGLIKKYALKRGGLDVYFVVDTF